ncbi:MAG: UDP-4-amino-4,6-dideoxy-N-acetyl-beta-L-altrosamine transaminase [Planctomycetota bacterium]
MRPNMLPYSKQIIDDNDIRAVVDALESKWLTTGPMVELFEVMFCEATGSANAVAVSSGTAALHAAMFAAGIGPDDEVIVPAITFVATANAAVYCGATPVFADVCKDTLLIDPKDVVRKITDQTRAIVAMDYGGQPCDYRALREIADRHGLVLIADACHSLGATYHGNQVGTLADLNCFSLHAVKQITTGEGGVVTTHDSDLAAAMRQFRNHGIDSDHRTRSRKNTHAYQMQTPGFNYRLTDFQCALGLSQLQKLESFTAWRQQVAGLYDELLTSHPLIVPLTSLSDRSNARHLYVVRCETGDAGPSRDAIFDQMRRLDIGVNVHYQPVFQHPFYQRLCGNIDHQCPNAEAAYETILSLPVFPTLDENQVKRVVATLADIVLPSKTVQRNSGLIAG